MIKRLIQVGIVFVVVLVALFAAAQLIRPDRTNPPTLASDTIAAHEGAGSPLVAVLDRSCSDCHSNAATWPSYTEIAPLSWLVAYGVREGRNAVNFSDWAAYPPERQQELLAASCRDASSGKMPGGAYTMLHPEAQLTAQDVETICSASRRP